MKMMKPKVSGVTLIGKRSGGKKCILVKGQGATSDEEILFFHHLSDWPLIDAQLQWMGEESHKQIDLILLRYPARAWTGTPFYPAIEATLSFRRE
jgi:hypothetical protein